jgi:transcriptional regulator with XRE-family HTH domain
MNPTPSRRYCRCGTALAADNTSHQCAPCQRQSRDRSAAPPPLPPQAWRTQQLDDAFTAQHIGHVARAYRTHPHHHTTHGPNGIPQTTLGQWLGLSQPQISRIENGPPIRNLDTLTYWARTLNIPTHRLWFDLPGASQITHLAPTRRNTFRHEDLSDAHPTPPDAVRLAHEWLVAGPPQLAELAGGRRIGTTLVEQIELRVAELRRMDDYVSGGDLIEVVERELRATTAVLREATCSTALGRRLRVATAELRQLCGWVCADAGRNARAARHLCSGISVAQEADDAPLAANLTSTLSYQFANAGDSRDALLLARTAVAGASGNATPKVQALLNERVAWANALAGDREDTERALSAVEDLYERSRHDDEPEWVYWLDETEINVMAGRCHIELGLAHRAVPLLVNALAGYDTSRTRDLALYTSWLVQAQVMLGDIDQAAAGAHEVLAMTKRMTSARSNDRIDVLQRVLGPYHRIPAVADFDDQVQDWRRARNGVSGCGLDPSGPMGQDVIRP